MDRAFWPMSPGSTVPCDGCSCMETVGFHDRAPCEPYQPDDYERTFQGTEFHNDALTIQKILRLSRRPKILNPNVSRPA